MFYNTDEEPEEAEADEEEENLPFGAEGEEEPPLIGLVGEITEQATQQVALMLLGYNGGKILSTPSVEEEDEELDDVEFFISSGGGSVTDMFTIYDLMNLVKNYRDIATFGYGKIYSAAVPLLAAGTKGKRHIAKNTRLMLHHCSSTASGPPPNMRSNFDELKKVEEMMVHAVADNSHLSAEEIYGIFSRNTDEYFSAEEALEMGIVDKII